MDDIERQPSPKRLYSEEDVREILERALALQGRDFTHADLEAMAEELGISPAQLQAAEAAWLSEQADQGERARFIAERRRKFVNDLGGFVALALLTYLAYVSRFAILPALAVIACFFLFFAAIELIETGYKAYFDTVGDRFEKEYDKWLAKREKRRVRNQKRRELPS